MIFDAIYLQKQKILKKANQKQYCRIYKHTHNTNPLTIVKLINRKIWLM